jgi:hypothetical protein
MKQTMESMTTMSMESKRVYARPAMQVVELKHQCHILAGSEPLGKSASMNVTYEEEDI